MSNVFFDRISIRSDRFYSKVQTATKHRFPQPLGCRCYDLLRLLLYAVNPGKVDPVKGDNMF